MAPMTSDLSVDNACAILRRLSKNSVTVSHMPLSVKDDLKRTWVRTELVPNLLKEARSNDLIVVVAKIARNQTKLLG